jgi:hypothetical protein
MFDFQAKVHEPDLAAKHTEEEEAASQEDNA